MTTTETMERFAGCHPSFQASITQLAEASGNTVEQVYRWWREYCNDCRNFDQSAILWEFQRWYEKQLNGAKVDA